MVLKHKDDIKFCYDDILEKAMDGSCSVLLFVANDTDAIAAALTMGVRSSSNPPANAQTR